MTPPAALPELRVGEGSDVHALVPGRPLIIGGVRIPHTHGLLGHSDADVLLHAICDAVLGAAALGDIGTLFPDDDARFRGADSRQLLQQAVARVHAAGWQVVNVDSTVLAQRPRLAPYRAAMVGVIAAALAVDPGCVNVKAKTGEHLGPVGQASAIAARATVLLQRWGMRS